MSCFSQDPYETEEDGWSDAGHYVTGCSSDWIDLKLINDGTVKQDQASDSLNDVGTSAALTSGSKKAFFAALTLTLAFML